MADMLNQKPENEGFKPPNVAEFLRGRPANYRSCLVSDLHLVQW